MNRGQWFMPTPTVLDDINGVISYFREAFPSALLVWRSTSLPHVNCSQYTMPLATPIPRSVLAAADNGYDWGAIADQTDVVKEVLRSNWTDVIDLDVTPAMELRPDGHARNQDYDCVHFLWPGPLSHWMRLLYNVLVYIERDASGEFLRCPL